MRRILLDTNIYGLIVEKDEAELFKELLSKTRDVIVYGCSVVRNELRETPKWRKVVTTQGARNLRVFMLEFYDTITKDRKIIVDRKTLELAEKYLARFRELTGQKAIDHLYNDFLLVACAAINNLDVIISEDHKTMLSIEAIRTYHFVSLYEGVHLPQVYTYEELKQLLKRWSL